MKFCYLFITQTQTQKPINISVEFILLLKLKFWLQVRDETWGCIKHLLIFSLQTHRFNYVKLMNPMWMWPFSTEIWTQLEIRIAFGVNTHNNIRSYSECLLFEWNGKQSVLFIYAITNWLALVILMDLTHIIIPKLKSLFFCLTVCL